VGRFQLHHKHATDDPLLVRIIWFHLPKILIVHILLTDDPEEAAAFLRQGELVAFPTETVYGLGADAFNPVALNKIFIAKGRPFDNPLIVHLADITQLHQLVSSVPDTARTLIHHFFPGPLTLILPKRRRVPKTVSAGLSTIGVRIPAHPVARAFLIACGRPVAAPSANRSGRPSPTTWQAVQADLGGRIACILRSGQSDFGLESTVVDCTAGAPVILRAGAVSLEDLRAVVPETILAGVGDDLLHRSPGTRYRHYAPATTLLLVEHPGSITPTEKDAYIGLDAPEDESAFGLCFQAPDVVAYAHALFDFFRRCEASYIETIYCQLVPLEGLGLALNDRLRRAAG